MSSLARCLSSGIAFPFEIRGATLARDLRRSLPHVLGFALPLGRGELVELLLAHRLVHLARGALELAGLLLAALGRERRARRLLLRLRFRRHRPSPRVSDWNRNGR